MEYSDFCGDVEGNTHHRTKDYGLQRSDPSDVWGFARSLEKKDLERLLV